MTRRLLKSVLFGVFMAMSVWSAPPLLAQHEETEQQRTVAELQHLWQRLHRTQDLEERVALADQVLKLTLDPRLAISASEVAFLLFNLGNDYSHRTRGERADNLEKAICRIRGVPEGV